MDDILFRLLLGHLFGDYLAQNAWMAENKKKRTLPCVVHCLLYTLWILIFVPELCAFSFVVNIFMGTLVFFSHFILDRTQIVRWWWGRQRGRYYEEHPEILFEPSTVPVGVFVYIVMDNVLHLTMMWLILKLFIIG